MKIRSHILFFIYLLFFHILQFNLLYANDFTISGAVSDSISGDYLVGANVYIENTAIGTSTDERGFNISDPTMNNEMHYDLISKLDNNVNELLLSTPLESRAKVYEEHYGASIDFGFRYNFK